MRDRTEAERRWIRRLLLCYPRRFRQAFGDEITEMLVRLLDEADEDRSRRMRVWARAWADALVHGTRERLARGVERSATETHEGGGGMMEGGARDVRFALRKLLRTPLMTSIALVTLAVGIGANAAIFSVINGVLLKPLPFEDPDRIMGLWHTAPGLGQPITNQSPATYLTYREESRTFQDIGMWDNRTVAVTGLEAPEQVPVIMVTESVFGVLGVRPVVGRVFSVEDDTPGTPETVVLAHGYWQERFGGDPGVLGRTLTVEGRPREVIGVMAPDIWKLRGEPSMFLPIRLDRSAVRFGNFDYQVLGRLAPGATVAQANADVERMIPMILEKFPGGGITTGMIEEIGFGPAVHPLKEDVVGDIGSVLWVLLGTVGMVLLIACANVANLFLVRAEGRQREVAVRTAMGARRREITRQFLTESVTLGILGGAVGTALAALGLRVLRAVGPGSLPRLAEVRLDPLVYAFIVLVSVLAGIAFGLIPSIRYGSPNLVSSLKEGGRGSSGGPATNRLRNGLVVGQVAMALVLLIGSGLMIRTFQALRDVDPGFANPEEVITFRLAIPPAEVSEPLQVAQFYEALLGRLEALPSVTSAGASMSITMDGFDSNEALWAEDFPPGADEIPPLSRMKWIAGDYFETMQNPVIVGRALTWADSHDRANVVVVTEAFTRRYWSDPSEAIGRRVVVGGLSDDERYVAEIVGVVGDVRDDGVAAPPTPVLYWPLIMEGLYGEGTLVRRFMGFVVRAGPGPEALLPQIREAVWDLNPNLPLASIQTLETILESSMARTSFTLVMLAIAALMALVLGAVGIYGVVSYVVSLRTREIGVRMALGAERSSVGRMVLRQGMGLAGAGVGVGLLVAFGATRVMGALLYEVSPMDPTTFVGVSLALCAVALVASYLPAHRAARVDPVETLKAE